MTKQITAFCNFANAPKTYKIMATTIETVSLLKLEICVN